MNASQNTLFVIDDDPKSLKAVAVLALSMKMKCETFASAEEFLDRYDPSLTGCALIDFRLRGMDGMQLQKRLRAMRSSLAVVLVSAYANVSMTVHAMKNGALAVIEKPYKSDDLADMVRQAMDHGSRRQQPISEHDDKCGQRMFAYDLHDGVAQYLVGAVMYLEQYQRHRDSQTEEAEAAFQNALELLKRSLGDVRSLIRGTHVATTAESIVDALENAISEFRDRLEIELIHDSQLTQQGAGRICAIYRMVQESLTNAWRHSQSEKVRIEARRNDGKLCVDVRDWGIGFDVRKVKRGRFGLQGINERARLLGGEATVKSTAGEGTCVSIRIPLAPPASQEFAASTSYENVSPMNRGESQGGIKGH